MVASVVAVIVDRHGVALDAVAHRGLDRAREALVAVRAGRAPAPPVGDVLDDVPEAPVEAVRAAVQAVAAVVGADGDLAAVEREAAARRCGWRSARWCRRCSRRSRGARRRRGGRARRCVVRRRRRSPRAGARWRRASAPRRPGPGAAPMVSSRTSRPSGSWPKTRSLVTGPSSSIAPMCSSPSSTWLAEPLAVEHLFDRLKHVHSRLAPSSRPRRPMRRRRGRCWTLATEALRTRRLAEVDELRLAIQWAVVHGHPRDDRDPMVTPGGDGTPAVREHAIPELAMARETHPATTRALIADGLDLVHRLPRTWAVVEAGGVRAMGGPQGRRPDPRPAVRAGRTRRPRRRKGHRRTRAVDRPRDRAREGHRGRPRDPPRRAGAVPSRALRAPLPRRRVRLPPHHRPRHRRRRRLDRRHGRPSRRHPGHHDGADHNHDELRSLAMGWLARPLDLLKLLLEHTEPHPTCHR